MKINEKIIETLKEVGIAPKEGLTYLLALYFETSTVSIPIEVKNKVNLSGIVYSNSSGLAWKIPLFENGQAEDAWSWVEKDYIGLFKKIGKGTNKREALVRMKALFKENPSIRKEDVLGATEMYLSEIKFPRLPHYFIQKGIGVAKIQDILEWIDKYKESQKDEEYHRDLSRRLQ